MDLIKTVKLDIKKIGESIKNLICPYLTNEEPNFIVLSLMQLVSFFFQDGSGTVECLQNKKKKITKNKLLNIFCNNYLPNPK